MCTTDAGFRGRRKQSGLSLVELVVAIVVLAVGLAAMLIAITNATRSGGDPLANKQTIAIAEAMLEEIELKPFNTGTFAGPYNCGTRPQFDAVSQGAFEQFPHSADEAGYIDGLGLQLLAPGESQQTLRQRCASLRPLQCILQQPMTARIVG